MNTPVLPLLIEADELEKSLGYDDLLIVDLSRPDNYRKLHVPGAVHIDYARIVASDKPVMGLLPDAATLAGLFSDIGIGDATHVVAYDDEGGGRAARLLWTLETAGHSRYSLLNGGLHAWANEGHHCETAPVEPRPARFSVRHTDAAIACSADILAALGDPHYCLLDVRSPDEFSGIRKFAARGGHIPGAVNMEWTQAIDASRNLRLKPVTELHSLLENIGATADRQVITYCQTHHRSAHTWFVLKYLGYPAIKGYPGSWSEWGNDPDLPVE